ncbi:hypothetical protein [Aestuariivivens sp. NBU2969]|uniref:hypothetical protein n=1 Tax=Aestuariivivens sp. NBU2969 TaxID=2873267 RepID=UPI001CBEF66B|nr:hypothetical protein [Aestuariivivens sp. NBU2969]
MKKNIIFLLAIVLSVTSCSLKNDTDQDQQTYKSLWHLINVSGGVSGVNDSFSLGTIVWSFNETTLKLTIENDNTDDTKQDGWDSGTYDYLLDQTDSRDFLTIGGTEVGELIFTSENTMIINENEKSTGTAADGLIYTLQRTLVAE